MKVYFGVALRYVVLFCCGIHVFVCSDRLYASPLEKALWKAGSEVIGSQEWNDALSDYIGATANGKIGQLNQVGLKAVRDELAELRALLFSGAGSVAATNEHMALLMIEFDVADQCAKSPKVRNLPQLYDRVCRINAYVKIVASERRVNSLVVGRSERLLAFLDRHGIRAFMPDGELALTSEGPGSLNGSGGRLVGR